LQGVEEKPTSLSFTDTCTTKIFKRWSRSWHFSSTHTDWMNACYPTKITIQKEAHLR
jgi:hypothetical protein